MVHGDDTGLVLPPRVAPVQVVVIPIPNAKLTDEERKALVDGATAVADSLTAAGVRVKVDARDNYTPGWKYNHWEARTPLCSIAPFEQRVTRCAARHSGARARGWSQVKGVPLRVEFGPRDLAAAQAVAARRDTRAKETIALAELPARAVALLDAIQADMLAAATARRNACIATILKWEEFVPALDAKKMVLAPWCEEPESEEWVKKKSGEASDRGAAKTLCIPFQQPPLPEGTLCFTGNGKRATAWALWGRSY